MKKIFAASTLLFFLAGCSGGYIRSKVETAIREALPNYIGPAKEYKVSVSGSSSAMMSGKVEGVHVLGTDVKVNITRPAPNGGQLEKAFLDVQEMSIDMQDIFYDMKSRTLASVANADIKARVTEESINRYVRETVSNGRNYTISLLPGKIEAELTASALGFSIPVRLSGRLMIANGGRVNFEPDSASMAQIPIPKSAVNVLISRINPVLDLSTFTFPVTLEKINVTQGAMELVGHGSYTAPKN
ncbi:MAG: DUF2993 domain-containing protein [Armatimonadota bacterium]